MLGIYFYISLVTSLMHPSLSSEQNKAATEKSHGNKDEAFNGWVPGRSNVINNLTTADQDSIDNEMTFQEFVKKFGKLYSDPNELIKR